MDRELPKWKRFEQFVARIQKQLSPEAIVEENARILGKSGVSRQIDVCIRRNVGQFRLLIVMDCKDWKDPVDIKGVEEFCGLAEDVSANKGAMICNSGFTEAAKTKAREKGIDLFRAVDVESKDWPTYASIPVLCDFRGIKAVSFTIRHTAPSQLRLPNVDPKFIEVYTNTGDRIDIISNNVRRLWNEGSLPSEPGKHESLSIFQDKVFTKVEEKLYGPIEVRANITVERRLYFGQLQIIQTKGFADELTGSYTTTSFTTADLDAREVESKWQRIEEAGSLSVKALFTLEAKDQYPIIEIGSGK